MILGGWAVFEPGTRGKESPGVALGGVKAEGGRRGRDFGFLRRGLLMVRRMKDKICTARSYRIVNVPIKRS